MGGSAESAKTHESPPRASIPAEINEDYLKKIKPIFQKSCFDCHSSSTQYPWYHSIPGVRGWIDRDIQEAREHMDLTPDFPFSGHGTPYKDLEAIKKEVTEGDMPPLDYLILHPSKRLSAEDRTIILEWTTKGMRLLSH